MVQIPTTLLRSRLCAILLASTAGTALAQPVLTAAINPHPGDQWHYRAIKIITNDLPGPAGANQHWDYSESGYDWEYGFYNDCLNCSFTNANLVRTSSTFDDKYYYKAGNTAYSYARREAPNIVSLGNGYVDYQDPEDYLRFPIGFNDTYTDLWHGTGYVGYNIDDSGSTLVTADAYGSITTPVGTFDNTLRIHRTRTSRVITNQYPPGDDTSYYTLDTWVWYSPDRREYVYQYMLNSLGGDIAYYNSGALATANVPAFAAGVRTYPNPASDRLTVSFEVLQSGHAAINLLDMTGRTVVSLADQDFTAGTHTLTTDVSKLPAAVYALAIRSADGRQVTRRVQVLNTL